MKYEISYFLTGEKVSLDLFNFSPKGGYEYFLTKFCKHLDESLVSWFQGVESGIGSITYRGQIIAVVWTDFPFAFSFDCQNKEAASSLQMSLQNFFKSSNGLILSWVIQYREIYS